jgi:hypothetical protein
MVDRELDRVPRFGELLGRDGPRRTVLAPEDWSALAWFETGLPVVGLLPPGYAKLAFDPAVFATTSQDDRRAALVEAWSGSVGGLVAVADRFQANRIVIPRDGDRWALLDQAAAALVRVDPAAAVGGALVEGNGWDAVQLDVGERLVLPAVPAAMDAVRIRTVGSPAPGQPTRLRLLAVPADGAGTERNLGTLDIEARDDGWGRGEHPIALTPDERLVIEAMSPATLQAITGWMPQEAPPAGWRVATQTDRVSVLERAP